MHYKRRKSYINVLIALFISIAYIGQVNAAHYENYYGIEMSNEEYNTLINLGFNENEIYYMNEQTYLENKDLDANLVSKNQKYYKTIYNDLAGIPYTTEVSKQEYENQPTTGARGTVTTTYKEMVSIISQNGSKYRFKVSVGWRNMPSIKSFDIIGVGFDDSNIKIDSSVYFNYYWCNSSNTCQTQSYYYDKKSTSHGGAAVYDLPDSPVALSATLYYDVAKNTSGTVTSLRMCGDYAHATSNVNVGNVSDYDIGIAGIELGSSLVTKYDTIPCAISTWSGSW